MGVITMRQFEFKFNIESLGEDYDENSIFAKIWIRFNDAPWFEICHISPANPRELKAFVKRWNKRIGSFGPADGTFRMMEIANDKREFNDCFY
jgi:hypothetical protein